jgi:hypothetical protein
MGSATTYARRYSYMSVLGLVADVDDDGNRASSGSRETQSRPLVADPETGEIDARLEAILLAAANGAEGFLADLAAKYNQYGKLSEKQLDSGFNAASKILGGERQFTQRAVPNEPPEFEYADEADRF